MCDGLECDRGDGDGPIGRHALPLIACLAAGTAASAAADASGSTAIEAVDATGPAARAEIDRVAETKVCAIGQTIPSPNLNEAALVEAGISLRPGNWVPSSQKNVVVIRDVQAPGLGLTAAGAGEGRCVSGGRKGQQQAA